MPQDKLLHRGLKLSIYMPGSRQTSERMAETPCQKSGDFCYRKNYLTSWIVAVMATQPHGIYQ